MCRSTTAAAIVAGGRARRLGGRDKSRLVIDGRTIIVRQLEILQALAADICVIAPDPDRFADLPVRVVADRIPGLGVIGGIDAALAATGLDRTIVIASDLPYLTSPLLSALTARADGHDGAWVHSAGGVEPLVACYRNRARARVAAFIAEGGRKAQDLGRVLDMATIALTEVEAFGDPATLLTNVNTPEDYARIQYGPA